MPWRAPGVGPRERESGQAMVEFAFVLMLFLAMLVSVFEGARMVGSYFALANAAAEAARVGAVMPSTAPGFSVAQIDNKIRLRARETMQPWINLPNDKITICRRATLTPLAGCDGASASTVSSNNTYGGSVIDVTVNYEFKFLLFEAGFLNKVAIPMTGYHRARIE